MVTILKTLRTAFCAVLVIVDAGLAQRGPIAMDRYAEGSPLYLLRESGELVILRITQNTVTTEHVAALPSVYTGADLTSTSIFRGRERLFVSMNGGRGRVVEYSGTGQEIAQWALPETIGGIDVDPDSHTIYVAAGGSRQIYALTLTGDEKVDGGKQFRSFATVAKARTLGALVYGGGRVYVADALAGEIYAVAPQEIKKVGVGCGQPVSLRLRQSASGQPAQLLIGDAAGSKILRLDVSEHPLEPKVFNETDLQEPASLVLGRNGELLVADRVADAVVQLAPNGSFVSRRFLDKMFVSIHYAQQADAATLPQLRTAIAAAGFTVDTDTGTLNKLATPVQIGYFTLDTTLPRLVQHAVVKVLGLRETAVRLVYLGDQYPDHRTDTIGIWIKLH